jgi:hypothetical protein
MWIGSPHARKRKRPSVVDYAVEIISEERLVQLFEYWLAKCGRRKMPTREDFDPSEISSLLPHLMMVDAIDGGAEFRVRLVGTALTEPTGGNATGQTLREITPPGPFADYVVGLYEEVVEVARPIYAECEHFDPELQPHSTAD